MKSRAGTQDSPKGLRDAELFLYVVVTDKDAENPVTVGTAFRISGTDSTAVNKR